MKKVFAALLAVAAVSTAAYAGTITYSTSGVVDGVPSTITTTITTTPLLSPNLRVTNTGDLRVTNTADNRTVSP